MSFFPIFWVFFFFFPYLAPSLTEKSKTKKHSKTTTAHSVATVGDFAFGNMDALTALLAERDGPPPEVPAAPEEIERLTTRLRRVRASDAAPAAEDEG